MFGVAVAQLGALSDEEKGRYRQLYCGLCHALKERYGNVPRLCLTYDLSFYVMLCDSLHEPPERRGLVRCATNPAKERPYAASAFTDYAADLSVAFAYHKCLDDWHDDRSVAAKAGEIALSGAYAKARGRIPDECAAIEACMAEISGIEATPDAPPDAAAQAFGRLLGRLFARDQGFWEDGMFLLGCRLGVFVYLMDAAVDFSDDRESGSYNPFVRLGFSPDDMRTLLRLMAGQVADAFERLPIERDAHLLRSVLYAGVWQKFNAQYADEDDDD